MTPPNAALAAAKEAGRLAEEEWRPVVGYPRYEVSSLGRVRTIASGHIHKPYVGQKGYPKIAIYKDGAAKGAGRYVHRLVAEAFLGCGDGLEVNHKDGVKTNNVLSNLEWVTRSQNEQHSRYVLGNLCVPVVGFHISGEARFFASLAHAVAELGLHRDAVRQCLDTGTTRRTSRGWCFMRQSELPAPAGVSARFFASGPEGEFFTGSHAFAETLLAAAGRDRDEWTITDLQEPRKP